jgi:cytochrome P450
VTRQMEEGDYTPEKEQNTKWTATSVYGGGIDTSVSSLCSFFLAMTIFPNVLRKAQEEIDRVVGRDRLPTFKDRPRLPFINAVQLEMLRWGPIGPLNIPHALTEDDVYDGYLIPKGSIVVANLWYANPLQIIRVECGVFSDRVGTC